MSALQAIFISILNSLLTILFSQFVMAHAVSNLITFRLPFKHTNRVHKSYFMNTLKIDFDKE